MEFIANFKLDADDVWFPWLPVELVATETVVCVVLGEIDVVLSPLVVDWIALCVVNTEEEASDDVIVTTGVVIEAICSGVKVFL